MTILFLILIIICIIFELLYWFLYFRAQRKKLKKVRKSLYKMLETRVLEQSLKYRITSGQAAVREYTLPFLYMEFENTKPTISYLFPLDQWITIGRNKENNVCIYDETFSRLHCKIGMINNAFILQDQGSVNGTVIRRGIFKKFVVINGNYEELQSGDRIIVGSYRMKVSVFYGSEAME